MIFRYEKQFSKKQNIMHFMVREPDGATMEQIAKEVFSEAPAHRQVNQTEAKKFFAELEEMLYEMILSGHLTSEDTRYFFKAAQTDVPLDGEL